MHKAEWGPFFPDRSCASPLSRARVDNIGLYLFLRVRTISRKKMSGFEVAGVVLGSFPILLNCLDYYRQGFEPLEEWWNFRTHFIAFVDDIRHQMMKYNGSMIRLLDPIIVDNDSLTALAHDPTDSRWIDGSLDALLLERLAGEHQRFLRVVQRLEQLLNDLKKLLRIKDSK